MRFRALVPILAAGILAAAAADAVREPARDHATGKFTYRGTVPVQGVSARVLLERARTWARTAYHPTRELEQLDATGLATLSLDGLFTVPSPSGRTATIPHTLTIEMLDGAYYYMITDLRLSADSRSLEGDPLEGPMVGSAERPAILTRVCEKSERLIAQLEHAMAGDAAGPAGAHQVE